MAKKRSGLSNRSQGILAVALCMVLLAVIVAPILLSARQKRLPFADFYDSASVARNLKSKSETDQAVGLINLFYKSFTMSNDEIASLIIYLCENDAMSAENRATAIRVCVEARGLLETHLVCRLLEIELGQGAAPCSSHGRRLIGEILIKCDPRYANGITLDEESATGVSLRPALIAQIAQERGVPIEWPAQFPQTGPP